MNQTEPVEHAARALPALAFMLAPDTLDIEVIRRHFFSMPHAAGLRTRHAERPLPREPGIEDGVCRSAVPRVTQFGTLRSKLGGRLTRCG